MNFLVICILLSLSWITKSGAVELLVNGNFDSGWVAWEEDDGGTGFLIITHSSSSPAAPQSGSYLAWMGGAPSVSQSLSQSVAVPSGTASLQVKGFVWIASEEPGGVFDTAELRLLSLDGALLEPLLSWSNVNETTTWTSFTVFPSGNYAGQTVRLEFSAELDGNYNTNFFFDTIEFIANVPTAAPDPLAARSWGSIKNLYR